MKFFGMKDPISKLLDKLKQDENFSLGKALIEIIITVMILMVLTVILILAFPIIAIIVILIITQKILLSVLQTLQK